MKKTDLAYFAGIFDGEGCIIIRKVKGYHNVMVAVANTNEWLCRQFYFSFGGGVRLRSKQIQNRQPIWAWQAYSSDAKNTLVLLLPYLKLKKPQAEIAIRFANRMQKKKGGRVTDGELAVREAERLLISNYNKPLKFIESGQNPPKR